MLSLDIDQTQQAWTNLKQVLFVPKNDSQYEQLVSMLDNLIDEVGENESHPLASLMEIVGVLIEKYEDENIPEI